MISSNIQGTVANRPAATTVREGTVYVCTDTPQAYYATGGAWKLVGYGERMISPAAAGSYTLKSVDNTFFRLAQRGDALWASQGNNSLVNLACGLIPQVFGATWRVTLKCAFQPSWTQYPEVAVVVADGITTSSNAYCMGCFNNNDVLNYENMTAKVGASTMSIFTQRVTTGMDVNQGGGLIRMSICSDGTSIYYQVSSDGEHWWLNENGRALPGSLAYYGFHLGNGHGGATGGIGTALIYENAYSSPLKTATINGATNATPIVVSFTAAHPFLDGDVISITGVLGNTNANNTTSLWMVNVVDSTHVILEGGVGNGAYTSGGTATLIGRTA